MLDAVAPSGSHELDPAGRRHVADVDPDAGRARELEHPRDRLVLCDRGPRPSVRERLAATRRPLLGCDPGADELVVLGVDSGQTTGRRDRLERAQQLGIGDPGKALRMGLECRQLERRGAGDPGGDEDVARPHPQLGGT